MQTTNSLFSKESLEEFKDKLFGTESQKITTISTTVAIALAVSASVFLAIYGSILTTPIWLVILVSAVPAAVVIFGITYGEMVATQHRAKVEYPTDVVGQGDFI